jgi:hypothetical protein
MKKKLAMKKRPKAKKRTRAPKPPDTHSEMRAVHAELAALTARVDALCGVLTPAAAPR